MAKVKGIGYDAMRRLVAQRGEEFKQAYFAAIKPEYQHEFEHATAVSWNPLNVDEETNSMAILAKMLYPNDHGALRKIGRAMAKDSVPRFYQIFIRIPSIEFVLKRTAKLWSAVYDQGEADVEDYRGQEATIVLKDFPEYPAFFREYMCGYFAGIGDVLGLNNMTVKKIEDNPMAWKWHLWWKK